MIRLLKGALIAKEKQSLTLMINGIGYQVFVANSLLACEDKELTLHIHTHVREDSLTLFGFKNKEELNFFEQLIGISGVGPKMALCILDMPLSTVQNAIVSEDVKTLSSVPGIGKKKAERIILELKNKIDPIAKNETSAIHPDVFITLETLGYKRHHIQAILSEVDEEITDAEEWIRIFLQRV